MLLVLAGGKGAQAGRIDRPNYLTGDYWKYTIVGDVRSLIGEAPARDTSLAIVGTRVVSVTNTGPDGIDMVESTSIKFIGSFDYTDDSGKRQDVEVYVKLSLDSKRSLRGDEAGETSAKGDLVMNSSFTGGRFTSSVVLRAHTETDLLENSWNFPLVEGQRGRAVTRIETKLQWASPGSSGASSSYTYLTTATTKYAVGEPENLTVAAGRFGAVPIDSWTNTTVQGNESQLFLLPSLDYGNHSRAYYSAEVGNSIRVEHFDPSGAKVMVESLSEYRYAKPSPWWASSSLLEPTSVIGYLAAGGGGVTSAWLLLRRRRRSSKEMIGREGQSQGLKATMDEPKATEAAAGPPDSGTEKDHPLEVRPPV